MVLKINLTVKLKSKNGSLVDRDNGILKV